jgi:hypothetical protein
MHGKKELILSLAAMAASVSAYSATYQEARASMAPPGESWLLSHHDGKHPDFTSVIPNEF